MRPLTQFPKTVYVDIPGYPLTIEDHDVANDNSFFHWLIYLTQTIHENKTMEEKFGGDATSIYTSLSDEDKCELQNMLDTPDIQYIIEDMTSQGIQFRVAMDYCIMELQKSPLVLYRILRCFSEEGYSLKITYDEFLKNKELSDKLTVEFVEKIRMCKDWTEFFKIMAVGGEFRQSITEGIQMRVQCDH